MTMGRWIAIALIVLAAVATCNALPPAVSLPPDSAPPTVVLDTYLRAWKAGDCRTAATLYPSGEVCGHVSLSEYEILDPSPDAPGTVEIAVEATTGAGEAWVAGRHTLFVILGRQPGGAWRITSIGTGP